MDPGYATRFATRYVAALRARDPSAVAALYAPDAVLETATATVRGRPALEVFYAELLESMAEIGLEVVRAFGDERGVAFEWLGDTRMRDGRRLAVRGCDVLTLRDGAIERSAVFLLGEPREVEAEDGWTAEG